jgi:hypothetical protein
LSGVPPPYLDPDLPPPPTAKEILERLAELERQQLAGTLSLEELQVRKGELFALREKDPR